MEKIIKPISNLIIIKIIKTQKLNNKKMNQLNKLIIIYIIILIPSLFYGLNKTLMYFLLLLKLIDYFQIILHIMVQLIIYKKIFLFIYM